jgi:ABC-type glycerol-3-phosphate transport system substrate-binding protein
MKKIPLLILFLCLSASAFVSFVAMRHAGQPSDEGQIILWHNWTGERREIFHSLLEDFNCGYKNASLSEVVFGPAGGAVTENLALTTEAGRPHLALVEREALPMLADEGIIFPVDTLFEGTRLPQPDKWLPSARQSVLYNGHFYGIPATLNPYVLTINSDLLAKTGVQPPSVWGDFLRLQKQLSASDSALPKKVWALNTRSLDSIFAVFCVQNKIGRPEKQQEELLAILQFLKDLRQRQTMPPYYKFWNPNFLEVTSGSVLFQVEAASTLAGMKASSDVALDVVAMPSDSGARKTALSDGPVLVLCRNDRLEAVRAFLTFFFDPVQYEELQQKFFFISPFKQEPAGCLKTDEESLLYAKLLAAAENAECLSFSGIGGPVYAKVARVVARLDASLISPDAALQEIVRITTEKSPHRKTSAMPISASWAESTRRVFAGTTFSSLKSLPVRLSCAQNEHESFQLQFSSKREMKNVEVEAEVVLDADGVSHKMPVALYSETDTAVKTPLVAAEPGLYPNALEPAQILNLSPDKPVRLWIDLFVPKDVPPEKYTVSLRLTKNGENVETIPVELEVFPFSLPLSPSQPAVIGLNYDLIARHYKVKEGSDNANNIMKSFYWFMVEHRISPYQPPVPLDSPEIGKFLANERVSACRIPFPPGNKEYDALMEAAKKGGWLEKLFVYFIDEPTYHQFPAVVETAKNIHRPEQHPKFLVTCFPEQSLLGAVDIWCIHLSFLPVGIPHLFSDRPEYFRKVRERQAAGDRVWWYTAGPIKPFPTLHIEDDPAAFRIIPWMQQFYGMDGFLHWEAANWTHPLDEAFIPGFGNGEGVLVYPGNKGPLPSIRLELLREGLEDMEYLFLLRERVREVQKTLHAQALGDAAAIRMKEICRRLISSEALMADADSFVPLMFFKRDAGVIEEAHRQTGEEIKQMMTRPYALVLTEPEENRYTVSDSVRIYGKTESGASVQANERTLSIDAGGDFTADFPLAKGLNTFTITVNSGTSSKSIVRNIEKY